MMLFRAACGLVLLSQILLLIMVIDTTGHTAILFSFLGMPALGAGLALYGVATWRDERSKRERSS